MTVGKLEESYGVYFYGPAVSGADFFEEQSGFVAADKDLPAVAALDPGDEAGDGAEDFGVGEAEAGHVRCGGPRRGDWPLFRLFRRLAGNG